MMHISPQDGNIDKPIIKDLKFDALFQSASMGIILVNAHGVIVMANPFACNQFGYTDHDMEGLVLEKIIPQRFHHKHVEHRNGYIDNPKSRGMGLGMTLSALKKDGTEFPVEISLGHFKSDDQQFAIAFIDEKKRSAASTNLGNRYSDTAAVCLRKQCSATVATGSQGAFATLIFGCDRLCLVKPCLLVQSMDCSRCGLASASQSLNTMRLCKGVS
jgi:PAS domain S-box-containing protein